MSTRGNSTRAELQVLLGEFAGDFAQGEWPRHARVVSGDPERFPIGDTVRLAAPSQLITTTGLASRILYRNSRGEQLTKATDDPDFSAGLFANGSPLIVDGFEESRHFDNARAMTLIRQLGLPSAREFYSVHGLVMPLNTILSRRCDEHPLFIWQIQGRMRWFVSPHVLPASANIDWDPTWPAPLPATLRENHASRESMPKDCAAWSLKPGDVLYIPRGHWHAAEAVASSFAVVFVPRPPTWTALMLDYLEAELREREEWRKPSSGLGSQAEGQVQPLQDLVDRLATELASSDPEDLLRRAVMRASLPSRTMPQLFAPRFELDATAALDQTANESVLTTDDVELAIGPDYVGLIRKLLDSEAPVSLFDLCAACPSIPPNEMESVLGMLLHAGVVMDRLRR